MSNGLCMGGEEVALRLKTSLKLQEETAHLRFGFLNFSVK